MAGQPAHPQQLQIATQLVLADAEVGSGLLDRDAVVRLQVRDEGEQPRQALAFAGHEAALGRGCDNARHRIEARAHRVGKVGRIEHARAGPGTGHGPGQPAQVGERDRQDAVRLARRVAAKLTALAGDADVCHPPVIRTAAGHIAEQVDVLRAFEACVCPQRVTSPCTRESRKLRTSARSRS